MRISDWSSDVCSSDLRELRQRLQQAHTEADQARAQLNAHIEGDSRQLAEVQAQIDAAAPNLSELQAIDEQRPQALREVEAALAQWQQQWDAYARSQYEAARDAGEARTSTKTLNSQTLLARSHGRRIGKAGG